MNQGKTTWQHPVPPPGVDLNAGTSSQIQHPASLDTQEQCLAPGHDPASASPAPGGSAAPECSGSDLLELLLAGSPDLIYFKDRESRFVRYSRAFREFLRLEDTNVLTGKTDFDLFAESHARPAYEDEQNIIRTGQPMVGKLEKETHTDGRVTWALTTKLPWRDRQGNIVGTFGISKDVTALKETEATLARERELFRALVETLPDAIYFKDRESRFVHMSQSKVERARRILLQKHWALHPNDAPENLPPHLTDDSACARFLIGKTDFDLLDEAGAKAALAQEQEIIRTGQPLIGRVERILEADQAVWRHTTKMPWRDEHGKIIGTFGVTRDITALKETEAKLEEMHKRLAHTSRMAGMAEVATDILHNVGNVLNSINVSCSMIMERLQEAPAANLARIPELLRAEAGRLEAFLTTDPKGKRIPDYLGTVAVSLEEQRTFALQELTHLRQHIDHVKQIVAMQQTYAKVAGVEEAVDLVTLVEDSLQINSSALDRHRVEVKKEFASVPQTLVDKHKVLQILVNLISNAKYAVSAATRSDKVITLRIKLDQPDRVKIEVADNGVGIAAENLRRVFVHGFTTRPEGHGFGLHSGALAAHELGGALTVQSAGPNQGSTFTLELPLKSVNAAKP